MLVGLLSRLKHISVFIVGVSLDKCSCGLGWRLSVSALNAAPSPLNPSQLPSLFTQTDASGVWYLHAHETLMKQCFGEKNTNEKHERIWLYTDGKSAHEESTKEGTWEANVCENSEAPHIECSVTLFQPDDVILSLFGVPLRSASPIAHIWSGTVKVYDWWILGSLRTSRKHQQDETRGPFLAQKATGPLQRQNTLSEQEYNVYNEIEKWWCPTKTDPWTKHQLTTLLNRIIPPNSKEEEFDVSLLSNALNAAHCLSHKNFFFGDSDKETTYC